MYRKTASFLCSLCKRLNVFDPFLGFKVKGFSSILNFETLLDFILITVACS